MQNKNENEPLYAGLLVRFAAYLIDWIIVGAALCVVKIPFGISSMINPSGFLVRDFIFQHSIADIIFYALGVSYFILLTYKSGATLGKKAMHIKVISTEEDRNPTFFEILYRETVGRFLSGLILWGGYFMILVQKENRGLHDWMADTKVIYYHEKIVHVKVPATIVEVPIKVPAAAPIVGERAEDETADEILNIVPENTADESVVETAEEMIPEVENESVEATEMIEADEIAEETEIETEIETE